MTWGISETTNGFDVIVYFIIINTKITQFGIFFLGFFFYESIACSTLGKKRNTLKILQIIKALQV